MADWKDAPLYQALVELLPAFVTTAQTPGQPDERSIDIHLLSETMGKSREGLYKWLRKGTVRPHQAECFFAAANCAANLDLLRQQGKDAPSIKYFIPHLSTEYAALFRMLDSVGYSHGELAEIISEIPEDLRNFLTLA